MVISEAMRDSLVQLDKSIQAVENKLATMPCGLDAEVFLTSRSDAENNLYSKIGAVKSRTSGRVRVYFTEGHEHYDDCETTPITNLRAVVRFQVASRLPELIERAKAMEEEISADMAKCAKSLMDLVS